MSLGYGNNDVTPWWGVVVAAGTPRPLVERLAGWFNQITNEDDTQQFLARSAFDPFAGSPEQMAELLKTDAARWKGYVEPREHRAAIKSVAESPISGGAQLKEIGL